MARASRTVPDESQTLCHGCGYVLDGLPPHSRCPECGRESDAQPIRILPSWENPENTRPEIIRLLTTSLHVIFLPRHFYRTLLTRSPGFAAYRFAVIHWAFSSLLLGLALFLHFRWFALFTGAAGSDIFLAPVMIAMIYIILEMTTAIAARLTNWEATYRGYRLPLPVVRRALYYHAAHYLPVSAVALAVVIGYQYLLLSRYLTAVSAPSYLYTLCALVILSAIYLFNTYWIAMRNIMYANR